MLLNGDTEELRLAYRQTYPLTKRQRLGAIEDDDDPEDDFTVIERLRFPRPMAEIDRENEEYWEFRQAEEEGRPTIVPTSQDLERYWRKRKQRIDFNYAQVNDSYGDLGTVLVLTRPEM